MLFRSLLERLTPRVRSHASRRGRIRPRTCHLALETLEDRLTPSASFSIGDITIVEGNTGTLNALVPVTLYEPHGNHVTVDYTTANGTAVAGSDYSTVSGTLTFNKNQTTRTIAVPIQGDRLIEANENFSVKLSNPKGATIADGLGIVTIVDNEPRASINNPSTQEGNTGTTTMTFAVTLQAAYDLPVTVAYATGGGTATPGEDYVAASGSVTFQPGQTYQPLSIALKGDRVLETNETVNVNLSAQSTYVAINNGVGVGTIIDDEPHISIADGFQNGSSMTFYVTLAAPCDEPVTVDFNTLDGTAIADVDYIAAWGTLTFNPGETTQVITVDLLAFDPGPYAYFYVQLSNPSTNAALVNDLAVGYWYYDYGGWW